LGFSLFFGLAGDAFANVLRILNLPSYDLAIWHLGVAVILGLLGVLIALLYVVMMKTTRRLAAPLDKRPVIRGALAGFLLGLLAMALPMTLFLGTNGLEIETEQAAQIGVGLLFIFALAKILALAAMVAFTVTQGLGLLNGGQSAPAKEHEDGQKPAVEDSAGS
jgi:H+/Cl- antiporter ClcA